MGASAKIEPMTSMETGVVQLLMALRELVRKSGSSIGSTISKKNTNTAMSSCTTPAFSARLCDLCS